MTNDAVRLDVVGRLPWIKKPRAAFDSQLRQSAREMVTGETHYTFGRGCRLRVIEHDKAGQVRTHQQSNFGVGGSHGDFA